MAAASETGYVPDDIVRSMRTAGTRTIGLAMSAISNTYFGEVVHSIERTMSRAGYSLLLADTHDDPATELRAVGDLLSRHVDGLLLAPSGEPGSALEYAAKREVPVVLIDRPAAYDIDQIACEGMEPTAQLVDHLAALGHSRIAMISGKSGLTTSDDRLLGYCAGMERNKLAIDQALVLSGDSSEHGAKQAFRQIWSQAQPPSAIVAGNNIMTIGAVAAAKEAGIRIPGDLALVAFDDFPWADYFHPGLTVMAQPTDAIGEQAAEMLLSRLRNPTLPFRRVVLKPRFVHRESCGCRLSEAVTAAGAGAKQNLSIRS